MRVVCDDVREDEMVLAFLRGELSSPTHGERVRAAIGEPALITRAELDDPRENRLRRRALALTRGYARDIWLFRGLPRDLRWLALEARPDEIGTMRHMDYAAFRQLTGGTLVVADGASNLDRIAASDDLNARIRSTRATISAWESWPPLIAVATDPASPHRILEGNTRASAYVAALPADVAVPVLAGYSARASEWHWYGRA